LIYSGDEPSGREVLALGSAPTVDGRYSPIKRGLCKGQELEEGVGSAVYRDVALAPQMSDEKLPTYRRLRQFADRNFRAAQPGNRFRQQSDTQTLAH
jgi:hypothetical protein